MTCVLIDPRKGHCDWCGKKLSGKRTRWCSRTCQRRYVSNHRWTQARAAAKAAATWYQCAKCLGFFQKIEVNHIVPCKGKHGTFGCWHHQDNLECLCHGCHVETTNEQRKEGLI